MDIIKIQLVAFYYLFSIYFILFIFQFTILNISMKILGPIIKSKSDRRRYSAIQLSNKLTCLIISDSQAQNSSTALSVGVGSLLDPIQAQGLAHYLQHMLFMGTKKYPGQNQYNECLAKNSGKSNAYTAQDETNYHFEVAGGAFLDVLDRFAQFFVQPLMSESSSQRELNAVHSQHSKNLLNDAWRSYQLWKSSAKVGHPLNKFSTGDKTTLNHPQIRNLLLDFYNKNYSSNIMKLVVYSKEQPQYLEGIVQQKFGNIQNKNLTPYVMETLPYDQTNLGNVYKVIPVKNKQTIQFTWILPCQQQHYRNSPGKYVSHLVGHEGPGSLLSFLIKEGLALELTAGSSDQHHAFTQLDISISLTDRGLQQHKLITQYLLYYIQILKQVGPQQWIHKQIQTLNKLKFDNLDRKQGMGYSSRIAKKLQDTKIQQIFLKDYLMEEWKPELINAYLNAINLKNLRITLTSKNFEAECNLVQPIYGTKYKIEPIQNILPRKCNVSLPPPNTFFPQDLTILPISTIQIPQKIYTSKYLDLFHKQDHKFQLPKGQIKLRLYFQQQTNAKLQVIRALYQDLLKNSLRQLKYMAETAYLESSLTISTYFLEIDIRGFNDSVQKFIPVYLKQILDFIPNDIIQFEDLRSKKRRQYQNFFKGNPYIQAYQYHIIALREGSQVDPAAKLYQIQKLKIEDLVQFGKDWKNQVFSEIYVGGNFNQEKAVSIGKSIQDKLIQKQIKPFPKQLINTIRSVILREGETWAIQKEVLSPQEPNSSLIFHFQYQKYDILTKILQDICINFVKQPAFDYLRTKEQLGYIVMCLPDDNRGVLGISILVQSHIKGSHQLKHYINNLIQILRQKIQKLTAQQLQIYKKSIYTNKLQKDQSLDVQTARFWGEIARHIYNFTRREQQLQAILKITLSQFKQFFYKVFLNNPKCFETHLMSKTHHQANQIARTSRLNIQKLKIAPSIEWFKKRMPLYPDYYAHL